MKQFANKGPLLIFWQNLPDVQVYEHSSPRNAGYTILQSY